MPCSMGEAKRAVGFRRRKMAHSLWGEREHTCRKHTGKYDTQGENMEGGILTRQEN